MKERNCQRKGAFLQKISCKEEDDEEEEGACENGNLPLFLHTAEEQGEDKGHCKSKDAKRKGFFSKIREEEGRHAAVAEGRNQKGEERKISHVFHSIPPKA